MFKDQNEFVKSVIRTVPDWPQPGIMFRDITPVFQNPRSLRATMDALVHRYMDKEIDVVAGIDARGFLLGVTLAYELKIGFVPVRKKGKLPYKTIAESYTLEYGEATIELNEDACKKGDRVLVIDDLIATGGTMLAAISLVKQLGGEPVEAAAIVDLPDLGGSKKIADAGVPVYAICEFEGD